MTDPKFAPSAPRLSATSTAVFVALALSSAACGSSALTCDVIADPANCWAATAGEIRDCLPPNTEIGEIAADRSRCTYPDGTQIVFDSPLPTDIDDLESFGFTVNTPNGFCGRVLDTFANRIEIESANHSAVAQLRGNFELICGGGPTYESDFDLLFDCAGEQIPPPTDGFDVTATEAFFLISSVTTPGDLWRCQTP